MYVTVTNLSKGVGGGRGSVAVVVGVIVVAVVVVLCGEQFFACWSCWGGSDYFDGVFFHRCLSSSFCHLSDENYSLLQGWRKVKITGRHSGNHHFKKHSPEIHFTRQDILKKL